jgi:alkaline phosphatase
VGAHHLCDDIRQRVSGQSVLGGVAASTSGNSRRNYFPAMVLAYIIAMGSEAKTATYSHAAQTLEPLTGNVVSREIQKAFPRSFGFHITSRIIVYAGADEILVERD